MSSDPRTLAAGLSPIVRSLCENKLGDITWFRTDWQRGGAATGRATWRDDRGEHETVVKYPVVQRELHWTRHLCDCADDPDAGCTPRVYQCGDAIGGYDLAWLVIEHFPVGPLGLHWEQTHIDRIADAAARFYAASHDVPVNECPMREPWDEEIREAQKNLRINDIADKSKWKNALKAVRQKLDDLVEQWRARRTTEWIHGDLHLANAMARAEGPDEPVVLIDLAEVRPGHWVEDAVYLERLLWARPDRLKQSKPVKAIAQARKAIGLTVKQDYPQLAMIRRVLLASTAPKFIRSEGHPAHLAACLNWLDRCLAELK